MRVTLSEGFDVDDESRLDKELEGTFETAELSGFDVDDELGLCGELDGPFETAGSSSFDVDDELRLLFKKLCIFLLSF